MTRVTLSAAKREAKFFLEKIDILGRRMKREGEVILITGCAESGAVRRASMELSRALSALRK